MNVSVNKWLRVLPGMLCVLVLVVGCEENEPKSGKELQSSFGWVAGFPHSKLEKFKSLIEAGADINARYENGITPLHKFLTNSYLSHSGEYGGWSGEQWRQNSLAILQYLIDSGADVNAVVNPGDGSRAGFITVGDSPLHIACITGHVFIPILVKAGADVNARNEQGVSPLMYAAMFDASSDVVKLLLDHGARVDAWDHHGQSALIYAAKFTDDPKTISLLVESGDDINLRLDLEPLNLVGPDTPYLTAAAWNPSSEVLLQIMDMGVDIHERAGDGRSALFLAAGSQKNPEVVEELIKAGLDIEARGPQGYTPLIHAIYSDRKASDSNGYQVDYEVIRLLLEAGANLEARCDDGKSAMDHAEANDAFKGSKAYWHLKDVYRSNSQDKGQ